MTHLSPLLGDALTLVIFVIKSNVCSNSEHRRHTVEMAECAIFFCYFMYNNVFCLFSFFLCLSSFVNFSFFFFL